MPPTPALGFSPSPGSLPDGVQFPDGPAYFTSRGSVMGQVPGEVVAAAFAVFNPEAVVPAVDVRLEQGGCADHLRGAHQGCGRPTGARPGSGSRRDWRAPPTCWRRPSEPLRPEGKPLFAGLRSLGLPGDPMGDMWRLADQLREYRGDAHTAAWTSAGLDATEVGLLTELYWGLPMRTLHPHARLVGRAARRRRRRGLSERGLRGRRRAHRRGPGAARVGRGGHRCPVRAPCSTRWGTRSTS